MTEPRAEVLDTAGRSETRTPTRYGFPLLPAITITVGAAVVIVGTVYAVLAPALGRLPEDTSRVTGSVTLDGTRGSIELSYALPDTMSFDIADENLSPSLEGTQRAVIGFTQGGTGLYGGGNNGAGQALFNIASRGVVVADVTDTKGHGLRGRDLGRDAMGFVTALDASELWEVQDIGETTLGGLPAIRGRSALVDDYWSHLDTTDGSGTLIELGPPSQIIVTDVEDMTVMVQIWAGTDAALDAWIPIAMELVDSLRLGTTE